MNIEYKVNQPINSACFIALLASSSLGERRPIDDQQCIEGMIANSNLIVSAWHDDKLIGIARSMSDFHYACYLSDLAVDQNFQRAGIGKQLLARTQQALGPNCKLILLAAPAANSYYEQLGFQQHTRCWILKRQSNILNEADKTR